MSKMPEHHLQCQNLHQEMLSANTTHIFASPAFSPGLFFENPVNAAFFFVLPWRHYTMKHAMQFLLRTVLPWRYAARNTMVLSFIAQADTSPTGIIEEKVATTAPLKLHRRLHQDMESDVVMSLVAVLVLVSLFDFIRRRKQTGASRPSTGLQTQETGITDCSTSSHQDTPPPDSTSQPA